MGGNLSDSRRIARAFPGEHRRSLVPPSRGYDKAIRRSILKQSAKVTAFKGFLIAHLYHIVVQPAELFYQRMPGARGNNR